MKEQVSRKWKNWWQNEVDEEKKGANVRGRTAVLAATDAMR